MKAYQKHIRQIVNPQICMNSTGFDDTQNEVFVFSDGRMLVAIPSEGQTLEPVKNGEFPIAQHVNLIRWKELIRLECVPAEIKPSQRFAVSNDYLTKLTEIGEILEIEWRMTTPIYWDVEDQGDLKPVIYTSGPVTIAIMKALV